MVQKSSSGRFSSGELALGAIAASGAAVILALGRQLTFGEYFWYFCAGILLDIPRTTSGKFSAFGVSAILSLLLCSADYIYLASFLALLGPYSAVRSLLCGRNRIIRHVLMSLFFFFGMMVILWFTPMFLIQLSATDNAPLRTSVILAAAALSFPVELAYSILFERVAGHIPRRRLRSS